MDTPSIVLKSEYAEYAAVPAIGRHHVEKGPTWRHAQYRRENPKDDTEAIILGRAVHCAVLEPDRFSDRYHVCLETVDRRTKAGKARWEEVEAEAACRQILRTAEYAVMASAIRAHRKADSLLCDGHAEPTCYWTLMDRLLKVRLDYWQPKQRRIVEIKTCRSANPPFFAREIFERNYHIQLAFQRMGLYANDKDVDEAWIVAVENCAPYCVAAFKLDPMLLDKTEELIAARFEEYLKHEKRGEFPAYPDETMIGIPGWALEQIDTEVYGNQFTDN